MPATQRRPECDFCGGSHKTVPEETVTTRFGEYGAPCPHCGGFHELDDHPDDLDRHPAVPEDEPVTVTCHGCNGSFKIAG